MASTAAVSAAATGTRAAILSRASSGLRRPALTSVTANRGTTTSNDDGGSSSPACPRREATTTATTRVRQYSSLSRAAPSLGSAFPHLSASFAARSSATASARRTFSSDAKRDFYKVLGASKGADKAEIKKAYFKLAKKYHPDTNKDDVAAADKFKEATGAYEILSDPKMRERYDAYGHAGVDPNAQFGGGGGGGGGNPFEGFGGFQGGDFHFSSSSNGAEINPDELFEAFFGMGGGGRRKRGPRKGADLQMNVRLSFAEAVVGMSKDLHLRYQVRNKNSSEIKEREVTVDIPAGIDNGMNLRVAGQGAEGDPGAPRGNLIVQIVVEDDEYFHRDGTEVHTECPISFTQAVLGGTVDVRTLTGIVEMKIPKGTQIDAKLMLRGKGIPRLQSEGQRGNHIVHLKIEIPKKVSARQEELLRKFDEEMKQSGGGIYGRLAQAAGSAFESIFGQSKKDKRELKEEENNAKTVDDADDGEEKKQQTA